MAKLNITRHEKMRYNPARGIDFYRVHFDIVGKSSTISDYLVLYKKEDSVEFGWFGNKNSDDLDFHWKSSLSDRLLSYAKGIK
jgi:hypothetical protein